MKIFFNWIAATKPFSLEEFTKTDLDILDFSITQREGEIALCQLTVPLNSRLSKEEDAVLFLEDKGVRTPLFRGKLMQLPLQVNDWHQQIELFAMPLEASQQLQTLREQIHKTADWDDLFVEEHLRQEAVEILEAIPSLFCWHPVTHKLVLSDLFQGRKERMYDATQIFQNSLAIKITNLPKPYMDISLVAEWIQEAQGEFNVFPLIERKFVDKQINTLTAKSLLSNWPRAGELLGRSGYSIVKSNLAPFIPTTTGVLGLYPQLTPQITFKEGTEKNIYLKRFWVTGVLKLGWYYRQRRREIVNFKLTHQNQLTHRTETKKLNLTLRLAEITNDLPSVSSAYFFETERGQKAIAHAIKIARCHLALSARSVEVIFKVPLEKAYSLNMDESIHIYHQALPGGKVFGKLIAYKLFVSFEQKWAELKVAIATGKEETKFPISIDLISQDAIAGLSETEKLTVHDFVETIEVKNPGDEQLEIIQKTALNNVKELRQILSDHQTEIHFKLKDLRCVDVLERRLTVKNPLTWSAPCQIKIGESNEVSSKF